MAYRIAGEVDPEVPERDAYAEREAERAAYRRIRRVLAIAFLAASLEGLICLMAGAAAHNGHSFLSPWLIGHATILGIAGVVWAVGVLADGAL